VLGVQVAHHETAAVQPDDRAPRVDRPVEPHRHPAHRAVLDHEARGVRRGRRGTQLGQARARRDRIGQVGRGEGRDERFQLAIHGPFF
jgi:hypothetical protein